MPERNLRAHSQRLLFPVLLTGLVVFSPGAASQPGVERMEAFVRDVSTLRAGFRQILLDSDSQVINESEGELFIKRPNRFRWDYSVPYEQLIVADGERLWLYDVDLEQVSVKALDNTLANTPAMLLSGGSDIMDGFELSVAFEHEGIEWLELVPKVQDTDFRFVRLGFEGQELRVMELGDQLDQTTRIEFSGIVRNPELDAELFVFVPPEGVDVIGDRALAGTE